MTRACRNDRVIALLSHSVSESGSYELDLRPNWVDPNCYFQLTQGPNHFSTRIFQISGRSGVRRIWSAPPSAQAPPSVSSNVTGSGSQAANDTTNSRATASAKQRPSVTLDSDGPDSHYKWNDIDCLDNSDLYYPGCWEVLNITSWLPKWFLETPVCQPGESEADCNLKNPGEIPEPWTMTFLREAVGGASGDCTIIGSNLCSYYFNADDGADDKPLERARFRYVRYNIYSKLSSRGAHRLYGVQSAKLC